MMFILAQRLHVDTFEVILSCCCCFLYCMIAFIAVVVRRSVNAKKENVIEQ